MYLWLNSKTVRSDEIKEIIKAIEIKPTIICLNFLLGYFAIYSVRMVFLS